MPTFNQCKYQAEYRTSSNSYCSPLCVAIKAQTSFVENTYLTLPTAGAAVAKPLFKAKLALAALRADLVEVANNLATIFVK